MANTLKFGNGEWYGKKDTILAYNDENNNYKPLLFDFSRNSSATVINKDGLIETVSSGQPRIDYKDDAKGALLLEPSRTNLVTKSENIQDWNRASNATSEFGYEDPFKGNKAVKLTSSSTAQSYQVYQSSTALSSGTTYTFSMYAKKGTGHIFRLDFGIPDNGFVNIDLRDGSLLQESGSTYYDGYSVTPISNGWYRISMTATFNSSAYYRAGLYSQQGDCYIAFSQIEQGSYATSYIPTSGSAVTRLADSCNNGGNEQVINSTEGVLYAEIAKSTTSNNGGVAISDSSYTNRVVLFFDNSGNVRGQVYSNGEQANIVTSGLDYTNNNKLALKYSATSAKFYVNGSQVGVDTSVNTPVGLSELAFDDGGGGNNFYGNVKNIQVFTTALSDEELEKLTTI
jgi:hypothetical protein